MPEGFGHRQSQGSEETLHKTWCNLTKPVTRSGVKREAQDNVLVSGISGLPRYRANLVNHEQLGSKPHCPGAMRLRTIGDLIAHPRFHHKLPAIGKLGVQFALKAKQNVAFNAPMIRQVSSGIFQHAYPDLPKMLGAPIRDTAFTWVLDRDYF